TTTKKSYNGSDLSCNTSSDGQVTVNAPTGRTSLYSYSGDGGTTFGSNNIFSGLGARTYIIIVKDANGCASAPASVIITAPPAITLSSAAVTSPILCNGGTATVTIAATGGTGTLSYTFNGHTNTTGVFSGVAAGTSLAYSITDANS